ncbi:MAG TPA: hypothetical protein DDX07_10585 [Porphyromonadaceae bacterium]|jgi:hypothetical protein|nr:hypothetical protein [Porphyromonadaceae bacterium]
MLFEPLFGIKLSDYEYLENAFDIRNNFAHRYYTSKFGEVLVIKDETLVELVQKVNKFVYELFNKVIKTVYESQ